MRMRAARLDLSIQTESSHDSVDCENKSVTIVLRRAPGEIICEASESSKKHAFR